LAAVDPHVELRRLLARKIAGLRALENPVDEFRGAAIMVAKIGPVAQKPAKLRILAARVSGNDMMLDRQLRDLAEVLDEKCIAEYQQGFGLLSLHLRKRGPELGKCADLHQMHAHAMIVRYGADAFLERHVIDISRIGQDPKP